MILKEQAAVTGWFDIKPGTLFAAGNDRFELDLTKTSDALVATTKDYIHPVSMQNLATNPRMVSLSGATTTVSTQYFTDPSFAYTNGGFTANAAVGTAAPDTTHVHSGTKALKLTVTAASGGYAASNSIPGLSPNTTYTVSGWFYVPATNTTWGGAYYTIRAGGTGVSNVGNSPQCPRDGAWHLLSYTFTTNANASPGVTIYLYGSGTTGESVWVDDVGLVAGITSDSFSGDTSADDSFTYSWTGTAGSSTSLRTGKKLTGYNGAVSAAIASTHWASSGSQSMRLVSQYRNPGSGYVDLGRDTGGIFTPMRGHTYTVMATAHTEQTRSRGPSIFWSVSGMSAENISDEAPTAPGTYPLRVTFTVPFDEAATSWRVRLYANVVQGEPDCWWDDVLIVEGVYNGPYFDGSTGSWDGAADNSTSTLTGPAESSLSYDITDTGWHMVTLDWSDGLTLFYDTDQVAADDSIQVSFDDEDSVIVVGGGLDYSSGNVYPGAADQVAYIDSQVTIDDVNNLYSNGTENYDAKLLYDGSVVVSANGVWTYSASLDDYGTIEGSKIEWSGNNATVYTSLDGEAWSNVQTGVAIPGLETTTDVSATDLFVKVVLYSENSAAFLDNLTVTLYAYRTVGGSEKDRPVTLTVQSQLGSREHGIVERNALAGTALAGGILAKDFDDPQQPIRAVEFWVNRIAGNGYLFDERLGAVGTGYLTNSAGYAGVDSIYIDGELVTASPAPLPAGEWHLVLINLAADAYQPLRFSDNSLVSAQIETLVDTNIVTNPSLEIDATNYNTDLSDIAFDGDSSGSLSLAGKSTATINATGFTATGGFLKLAYMAPDNATVAVSINGTQYSQDPEPGEWNVVSIPLTGTVSTVSVTAAPDPALTSDTVFADDDVLLIDAVAITSTDTDYFDGNTTRTNYLFNWTGESNESTSTKTIYAGTPADNNSRFKEICYYRTIVSADEALKHYQLNVGKPKMSAMDTSVIQLTEQSYQASSHAWSIVAS